jgi:hypothetical protein
MPSPGRWAVALLIGTLLAIVLLNVAPQPFELSEEMAAVNVGSPTAKQIEAQQAGLLVLRKNATIGYALAGGALGLGALLVVSWRRPGRALLTVVGSVIGGSLLAIAAVWLAGFVFNQFEIDGMFAELGADDQSMVPELAVWVALSVMMALPVGLILLFGGEPLLSQRMMAVPLAGLVTGLLFPIAISLLLPKENSAGFPPEGWTLTGIWLATLALFLFLLTTMTGARQVKTEPVPAAETGGAA